MLGFINTYWSEICLILVSIFAIYKIYDLECTVKGLEEYCYSMIGTELNQIYADLDEIDENMARLFENTLDEVE